MEVVKLRSLGGQDYFWIVWVGAVSSQASLREEDRKVREGRHKDGSSGQGGETDARLLAWKVEGVEECRCLQKLEKARGGTFP